MTTTERPTSASRRAAVAETAFLLGKVKVSNVGAMTRWQNLPEDRGVNAALPPPPGRGVVLDVSRMLPEAVLVRNLVDLGARVIKIEDPHAGDGVAGHAAPRRQLSAWAFSPSFAASSRWRSTLKDACRRRRSGRWRGTRRPRGSFRPGDARAVGSRRYERLAAQNPGLVVTSPFRASARRRRGRRPHRATWNFTALTGFLSGSPPETCRACRWPTSTRGSLAVSSHAGGPPPEASQRAGPPRRATARRRAAAASHYGSFAEVGRAVAEFSTGSSRGGVRPTRTYGCADGAQVALGAIEPKFWEALCETAGIPGTPGTASTPARLRTDA
ncbi:MAG: CoA transferase, partial [Holophagales bacterium]|nr:CoA transferase [Holophagales bacterium]